MGGTAMRRYIVLILCSLVGVAAYAQSSETAERPVWTMEFVKVRPGQFGATLGYLDDHWMRIRKEAKRQGAVLSYHRFAENAFVPGDSDQRIVLVTEFKNEAAFLSSENLFALIAEQLPGMVPGVTKPQKENLYEVVGARVFLEFPDTDDVRIKLLTKQ